ncbi:MAG: cellulase family glycosylhydrolase [Patescibacteria group bacterium]
MLPTKKKIFRILRWFGFCVFAILITVLPFKLLTEHSEPEFGFTFSNYYAQYLGLDVPEVYEAVLTDMDFKHVRIPVYWTEIESSPREYDFSQIDYLINSAGARGVGVTLAIGVKVPRWPECFVPDWADDLETQASQDLFYEMMETVVNRYKDNPALERWQVENEPFFPFGECLTPDPERYAREIALVRELDPNHVISSTTSGEQSLWFLRAKGLDVLGVSMYREVWNKQIGAMVFPHSPSLYALQRLLASPFLKNVIISELQMEPWIPEDIQTSDTPIEEFYSMFPVADMIDNLEFAKKIGVSEIDVWGVEWWYYLKERGEPRLWETAIELFNTK